MTCNVQIDDAHNITVSLLVGIQTVKRQKITIFGHDTKTNPVVTKIIKMLVLYLFIPQTRSQELIELTQSCKEP